MTHMVGVQPEEAEARTNVDCDWLRARIRTVLLATDFLQSSHLALNYAAAFAHHFQAQLIVVHAFELGPEAQNVELVEHQISRTRRDAEARLQAFASGIEKFGISIEPVLVEGTVPKAILKAVSDTRADLLVLGTQGVNRGFNHLLIGSNTEALMLASSCPTLTIGPRARREIGPDLDFTEVVCVSDFTTASAAAALFAQALGADLRAKVDSYQVLADAVRNDTARVEEMANQYCNILKSLRPTIDPQSSVPEFQLSRVRSPEAMLAKSIDTSALIVLGVQPISYLGRHLHTSFAYRLLANAPCPILTVPE